MKKDDSNLICVGSQISVTHLNIVFKKTIESRFRDQKMCQYESADTFFYSV